MGGHGNDKKNALAQIKRDIPTLISFNGSGFDLHFLVRELCNTPDFIV